MTRGPLGVRASEATDVPFMRAMLEEALLASPAFLREVGMDALRLREDAYWSAWLAKPDPAFVAFVGDELLGAVTLKPEDPKRVPGARGFRLGIGVVAKARRSGVGSALLEAALAFAGADGARYSSLWVDPDNVSAIALYERHGFVVDAVRPSAIGMLRPTIAGSLASLFPSRDPESAVTVVARTGDELVDFAPYVPAIDGEGRVVFTASRMRAPHAILRGDGHRLEAMAVATAPVRGLVSHPATTSDGAWCAYAELADGTHSLVGAEIVELGLAVGPLGPTMNASGAIAFRGYDASGRPAVFVLEPRASVATAVAVADGHPFVAFHGLPVIDAKSSVVFRADCADGSSVIVRSRSGAIAVLVSARDEGSPESFRLLGAFPCVNAHGAVAFAGERHDGRCGAFAAVSSARIVTVVDGGDTFESVRGALIDDAGRMVCIATPRGGKLGVYDAISRAKIIAIGDTLVGSSIVELALNPVSINAVGSLALRVALASGTQLIVRIDRAPSVADERQVFG